MENNETERVGSARVLSTVRFTYLILFILSVLCSFFVFRVETVTGGMQPGFFGGSHYVNPSRKVFNAFDLPAVFIEHGLLLIVALFMALTSRRIWQILGIVAVSVAGLFMVLLYIGLEFNLNLFGPTKVVKVGVGYYLLLLVYIGFFVTTIYTFRKLRVPAERKVRNEDLLDENFH